jgi:hypothetical protein
MSDDCSRPITALPEAFIGMLSSKDFGKLVMKPPTWIISTAPSLMRLGPALERICTPFV